MRRLRRTIARAWLIGGKLWHKIVPPAGPAVASTPPPERESLREAVVVITGASGAIGAALATGFAREGAQLVLVGRERSRLSQVCRGVEAEGSHALPVAVDLNDEQAPGQVISETLARFGRIDVWINNAGVSAQGASVLDLTPQAWREVWQTNVDAVLRCSQAAADAARDNGHPLRIINVSSGIAGHASQGLGAYAVSKDALEALTRAFALEGAPFGVSTTAIRPRSVRSEMTRRYYGGALHELLDDPAALVPTFLWAATAPAAQVNGRCFAEPILAASTMASALTGRLAAAAPIRIAPLTFSRPELQDSPGAYMHLLENASGWYPRVAQSLCAETARRALYAYPDPSYRDLKHAIAHNAGCEPGEVAVAPGSSELINRLLQLFCAPGDRIVITKPTWSFFHAFAQRWQVSPIEVPMRGGLSNADLQHDLDGLLSAVTPDTRLVYLCNPCNPTGSMVAPAALEAFVAALPGHVTAVIDEAYVQYADPSARPNLVPLLHKAAARVVVLRTFSKFYALAGFRLGYALARPDVIDLLARGEMPFGVSTPAALAAQAALADHDFRDQVHSRNAAGRRQLLDGLKHLQLDALPSQTNFLLFDAPVTPQRLRDTLMRGGLILPQVDQFLRNYMVLPVGTPDHNHRILEELGRL